MILIHVEFLTCLSNILSTGKLIVNCPFYLLDNSNKELSVIVMLKRKRLLANSKKLFYISYKNKQKVILIINLIKVAKIYLIYLINRTKNSKKIDPINLTKNSKK